MRSSVLPWRSLGASPPEPDANRRAEFPVPSLWAKLLEEIRLGHSSAERRPGIVDVKNGVTGRVRSGLSENTHWGKLSAVTFRRVFLHLQCLSDSLTGRAGRPGKKTWEILGYGFQDMVFKTWDLNFGAWEILGYDFQDMVFRIWDLNFGAWIFTLAVSKTETWKLLGRDFQDVGSQFWDLDFTQVSSIYR